MCLRHFGASNAKTTVTTRLDVRISQEWCLQQGTQHRYASRYMEKAKGAQQLHVPNTFEKFDYCDSCANSCSSRKEASLRWQEIDENWPDFVLTLPFPWLGI